MLLFLWGLLIIREYCSESLFFLEEVMAWKKILYREILKYDVDDLSAVTRKSTLLSQSIYFRQLTQDQNAETKDKRKEEGDGKADEEIDCSPTTLRKKEEFIDEFGWYLSLPPKQPATNGVTEITKLQSIPTLLHGDDVPSQMLVLNEFRMRGFHLYHLYICENGQHQININGTCRNRIRQYFQLSMPCS
ncbi:hypothetical protein RFI_09547 [Reticulomyxa filosa]|uniref:Uncharacterized protein n=1 Tax=Reticulomyxa filosa TaxID=46433 RepID=X6NNS3_RETFI|nr:hypothetical protein RFI_09547 [Reticulomyxa filosa]|eukprot:ETO27583.1 hypothetical protein RFI_09547 [Reticulomyxa filosa]